MLLSVKVSIIVTTKWERFKVMEILLDNGRFNLFTYRREVLFASLFDSKRYTEKVEGNTDLDRCWIAEGKIKGYNTEILFRPDANYLMLDTPQLSNEDYFSLARKIEKVLSDSFGVCVSAKEWRVPKGAFAGIIDFFYSLN